MVELNVSFKKPQWNLYKVDNIGAWQKCPLYGDVRFIESASKNQKSSKVNIKSTICHDFPSPDLLEGQMTERLKKMQSCFHSKVFKQGSLHQVVHVTKRRNAKKTMDSAEKRIKSCAK